MTTSASAQSEPERRRNPLARLKRVGVRHLPGPRFPRNRRGQDQEQLYAQWFVRAHAASIRASIAAAERDWQEGKTSSAGDLFAALR